jgi:hypothetical protein
MAPLPRLTLIPYLQSWDGASATLTLNVLAIPDGDPRAPLTDGFPTKGPPISEAQLTLRANISSEVGQLPIEGETSATVGVPLAMPAERARVFEALEAIFKPSATASLPVRSAERTLHKFLPPSYRDAFAFVAPRTALASVEDEYKCMLRCPPKQPLPKPKPITYSWVDALGYALRQPLVLRAAGLLHTIQVALPKADLYAEGGWLFLTLDPASDYASSARPRWTPKRPGRSSPPCCFPYSKTPPPRPPPEAPTTKFSPRRSASTTASPRSCTPHSKKRCCTSIRPVKARRRSRISAFSSVGTTRTYWSRSTARSA